MQTQLKQADWLGNKNKRKEAKKKKERCRWRLQMTAPWVGYMFPYTREMKLY